MKELTTYITEKLHLNKNIKTDNIDEYCIIFKNILFEKNYITLNAEFEEKYKLNKVYSKAIQQYIYVIKKDDAKEFLDNFDEDYSDVQCFEIDNKINYLKDLIIKLNDEEINPYKFKRLKF